jgi:group I intron endonuclease
MMSERKYLVYVHTSPSGKRYVGITSQSAEERWRKGKGYKDNQPFFKAIKKYGWENITHEIVAENINYDEAATLEKFLIAMYRTTNKKYGYNICYGGEDGWVGVHHTDAARAKMSASKKGKPSSRKGYHLSDETKRKLSESHKGKYHGKPVDPKRPKPKRKREPRVLKGYFRSDEVRKRMSAAQVKTKKPVRCIDTGEVFESETAAMKKLNIDKCLIGRACKGKQKTAKGYRFEYV